jgi:hypothetical protein
MTPEEAAASAVRAFQTFILEHDVCESKASTTFTPGPANSTDVIPIPTEFTLTMSCRACAVTETIPLSLKEFGLFMHVLELFTTNPAP